MHLIDEHDNFTFFDFTYQVLERIKPIDQKLRYQIDKLIKAANTGQAIGRNDPLQFKPNPDALVSKV